VGQSRELSKADKHIIVLINADAGKGKESAVLVRSGTIAGCTCKSATCAVMAIVGARIFDPSTLNRQSPCSRVGQGGVYLPPLNGGMIIAITRPAYGRAGSSRRACNHDVVRGPERTIAQNRRGPQARVVSHHARSRCQIRALLLLR